jgi:hypothetical protein
MTFKQFFPIPVFIAAEAVTLVMLAPPSPVVIPYLWTWISFQAWAMYFLAGCTLKGGVKVWLGYLAGAVASVAIFEINGLLQPLLVGPLGEPGSKCAALSVAVFLVVIGVICGERIPWFDFVPSWFIGAGVFFGIMSLPGNPEFNALFGLMAAPKPPGSIAPCRWVQYLQAGGFLMVSCAVGLVYGVVTVFIRTRYTKWIEAKKA